MNFTIDELIAEMKEDKEWALEEPRRSQQLNDFAYTLFGL